MHKYIERIHNIYEPFQKLIITNTKSAFVELKAAGGGGGNGKRG